MKIFTMWITRKGVDDGTPELLVAIDEYAHDENPAWFKEESEKELDACGDDVDKIRNITLVVDQAWIDDAFVDAGVVVASAERSV
jgi:hypothetical protein